MNKWEGLVSSMVLIGVVVMPSSVWAQKISGSVVQQLQMLHSKSGAAAAYDYGRTQLEEWEGDAEFDYHYGMAAVDAGYLSRGIFALERVLYQQPNNRAAELEIARAYYMLEHYPLARQYFLSVLNKNPPADVAERINSYLALINQAESQTEATWTAYAELVGGYDNNANFATGDGNIFVPLLNLTGEFETAQSAWFNDTLLGAGYYHPLDKKTTLFGRIDYSDHNVIISHEFDSTATTLQAGAFHKLNKDLTLSGQFIHQLYRVDNKGYRNMNGVAGNAVKNLSAYSSVQLGLSYLDFTYRDLDDRNTKEYNINAGYNRQVNWFGQSLLQARVMLGTDDPDNRGADHANAASQTEKDFWGFTLAYKLPLNNTMQITSTFSYLGTEYALDNIAFKETREDDMFTLGVSFDWRWVKNWRLNLSAGYQEQSSNIEINDFDRLFAQVGVRYDY
jgi:tetratricopeptide (TPR) repeat protein